VIRKTVTAALAMRGKHTTWVLDDGKSDEVRDLAGELGARYVRRLSSGGAKAGNVNHALTLANGELFAIFDADFVPNEMFLVETVPFFIDPKVAFVQTPQTFANLRTTVARGAGYMQTVFYRFIQPGAATAFEIVAWRALSCLVVCLIMFEAMRGGNRPRRVHLSRLLHQPARDGHARGGVPWREVAPAPGVRDHCRAHRRRGGHVGDGRGAVDLARARWVLLLVFAHQEGVGGKVDALTGLTIETAAIAPVAIVVLLLVQRAEDTTFGVRGAPGLGWWHDTMLAGTGTWTAGALLLFAAGARRLPLNITGMLQYIAPTMTFVLAVWYFHESMPAGRWVGFGFVWVAFVLFSIDAWRIRPGGARAQLAREQRAREDAVIAAKAI